MSDNILSRTWQDWKMIGLEAKAGWTGTILVMGVAFVSRYFHNLISNPSVNKTISEILIAVLLGLFVRNFVGVDPRSETGVKFAIQRVLRLGIILLGLRLSLQDVLATGASALLLVLICITLGLTLAYTGGRLFKVPAKLAVLIGVGTAICGNSAIVATAPVIEAKDEEVSFAVATITLFGLIAVIVFPWLGQLMGLSDRAFGLWAGTAVNDTSQVVAVGASYSTLALNIATVVKLTRNTLMVPLIVLFGILYRRGQQNRVSEKAIGAARFSWSKLIPGFVLGFILMSLIRTAGIASGILPLNVSQPGQLTAAADFLKGVDEIAKFTILMALAGVGLNTNLASLRKIGIKPLIVGLCVAITLAASSIALILFTPLGQ